MPVTLTVRRSRGITVPEWCDYPRCRYARQELKLRELGLTVSVPMKGLKIGEQLSWLNQEL